MTAYQDGGRYSAPAGADMTGNRYKFVKLNSSGQVVLATGATDAILGVLDNEPISGRTADVVLLNGAGTFKVKAGGTIAKDAYITCNASSVAVATTNAGDRVCGRAVTAAVSGDVVEYIKSNEKY